MAESVATVPGTTGSPGPFGTGRDSPVTIDSSSSASPSTITPVSRHATAGSNEHDIADAQVGEGDVLDLAVVDDSFGVVGQQLGRSAATRRAWPIAFISANDRAA